MKLDLGEVCRRLDAELARIEDDIAQATVSAGTVTLDQSSVGRLSRMDAMQQQAMAQGMRARLETRKRGLQAALTRVDAGTYGCCCACGTELETERLQSDPAAVFCADCMAQREAAAVERNG
ncbi:MAG TPA: molecular chaperone DnaK [Rhodocyclaceae bacterium]|jgi:DnaK suppressor protein|nr:molecular chaperone DnaK [Rhodocyclaceae bacterium]HRQ46269.1 molecular chaperone DnaK [Rhodocyclaceae bacterium]